MNWNETIASRCSYGNIAGRIFGDWEIFWEDSRDDWQGHARILAKKDGQYAFYEWEYGSCDYCDDWAGDRLDDAQVEAEMRKHTAHFDRAGLKRWLDMLVAVPNGNDNGRIEAIRTELENS